MLRSSCLELPAPPSGTRDAHAAICNSGPRPRDRGLVRIAGRVRDSKSKSFEMTPSLGMRYAAIDTTEVTMKLSAATMLMRVLRQIPQ
jgi:hypothetical protein